MKHKIGNASDLCYRYLLYINPRYGDIATMAKSNFFEKISCSTQESQVQETYNKMFNESHPEYQINNWDAGWYQIKALLKEFMPNELKTFRTLHKQLGDKIRQQVYELGFLK